MNIRGYDFTSAPSKQKPITCAVCTLQENQLRLDDCLKIGSFEDFERMLREPAPWVAALDFPFGLPRKLLVNLGWPQSWADYVQLVATLDKSTFEKSLSGYSLGRVPGDKLHLRATDRYAGARSPMMLHRVPVAKMFFQGAPRMLACGASILPCRASPDTRILVEGYPALVARTFNGHNAYKSDARRQQTSAKQVARQAILAGLLSPMLETTYGLNLQLSASQAQLLIAEPQGDVLDALLCAVQAAWAYLHRNNGYGIPPDCDQDEGWIIDPAICAVNGNGNTGPSVKR